MADNQAQRPILDVPGLTEALKRLAQQSSPIHAAISHIHRQFKSQATPARVVQIHIWED